MKIQLFVALVAVIVGLVCCQEVSLRTGFDMPYDLRPDLPLAMNYRSAVEETVDVPYYVGKSKADLVVEILLRVAPVVGTTLSVVKLVAPLDTAELYPGSLLSLTTSMSSILGYTIDYKVTAQPSQFSTFTLTFTLPSEMIDQIDALPPGSTMGVIQYDWAQRAYFTVAPVSTNATVTGYTRPLYRCVFTPQLRLAINSTSMASTLLYVVGIPSGTPIPTVYGQSFLVLAPNRTYELPNGLSLSVTTPVEFNLQIDTQSTSFAATAARASATTNGDFHFFEIKLPSSGPSTLPQDQTITQTLKYKYDRGQLAAKRIKEDTLRFVILSETENSWKLAGEPIINPNTTTIEQPITQLLGKWALQGLQTSAAATTSVLSGFLMLVFCALMFTL